MQEPDEPIPIEKEAPTLSGWRLALFIGTLLAAAGGYLLFIFWAGFDKVKEGLFDVGVLGILRTLLIVTIAYLLRFFRWQLLLINLKEYVPPMDSLRIFFSGFALAITPLKSGELIRAFFLKKWDVPYRHGVALYFSERLFDMSSVLLIATLGIAGHPELLPLLLFGTTLVLAFIFFSSVTILKWLEEKLQLWLPQKLGHYGVNFIEMLLAFRASFSPKILLYSLALGVLAWGLEAFACFLLLKDLGAAISLFSTLFIYAISLIAGAVSFLPAGVGGTEVVMGKLFLHNGVEPSIAALVVVVIRLLTVWYGVLLGLIALPKKTIGLHHKEI